MEPIISIVCNTYNHEQYVRETLEGFLKQKTKYSFEILIYDDASSDNTANIIKEYEKKYPDIIKPIYQTINQYSQGLKPARQNRKRAKGKYIAVCEGDDYWIDENKLQKQVEYMEEHPKCTFCFTNGFNQYGDEIKEMIVPWNKSSIFYKGKENYNVGELVLLDYIPTASFLYRNGFSFPELSKSAFTGDLYIELVMTSYGYAHFIDKPMVIYRRDVAGSATNNWGISDKSFVRQCDRFINMFKELRTIFNNQYDECIDAKICQWKIEKYCRLNKSEQLYDIYKSGEIKATKKFKLVDRIKYYIKCRNYNLFIFVKSHLKRTKSNGN